MWSILNQPCQTLGTLGLKVSKLPKKYHQHLHILFWDIVSWEESYWDWFLTTSSTVPLYSRCFPLLPFSSVPQISYSDIIGPGNCIYTLTKLIFPIVEQNSLSMSSPGLMQICNASCRLFTECPQFCEPTGFHICHKLPVGAVPWNIPHSIYSPHPRLPLFFLGENVLPGITHTFQMILHVCDLKNAPSVFIQQTSIHTRMSFDQRQPMYGGPFLNGFHLPWS